MSNRSTLPKTKLFFFLLLAAMSACSYAGDVVSAVSVSVSEIRADAGAVDGKMQVSSGQPDTAVLRAVKDAGFVAVIDMRAAEEERGIDEALEVESLGMEYVHFPIATGRDISYENAAKLDRLLAEIDGPVLVHCASGNRVGALYALRAKTYGSSATEAMQIGKDAGLTRLAPLVKDLLQTE